MRKKVLALLCVMMMRTLCACGEKQVTPEAEQILENSSDQAVSVDKNEEVEKADDTELVEAVKEGTIIVEGKELPWSIQGGQYHRY